MIEETETQSLEAQRGPECLFDNEGHSQEWLRYLAVRRAEMFRAER